MEYNSAQPIQKRPAFAEGSRLASTRDTRNNPFLWKKAANTSAQLESVLQATQKTSREVAKMRRRIVGGFVPTEQEVPLLPFQIYPIENATDSTKTIYTFQIRSGLVGFRPAVFPFGFGVSGLQAHFQGNNELMLVGTGTDNLEYANNPCGFPNSGSLSQQLNYIQAPTPNDGGSVLIPKTGVNTLICSNAIDSVNPANVQIVIEPPDPVAGVIPDFTAAFWIVIKEDATYGAHTELWGNCNKSNPFQDTYPDDNMQFAVASISYAGGAFYIDQIQVGNLVNRYLQQSPFNTPDAGRKFRNIPQVHRGYWSQIPTAEQIGGEDGKICYPGDIIVDDTVINGVVTGTGGSGNFTYYDSYICIADAVDTFNHSEMVGSASFSKSYMWRLG